MNFSQYNNIGSQVTIQNQYNRFLYDRAIKTVRAEHGKLDRRNEAHFVTEDVRTVRAEHFRMLTGKSITTRRVKNRAELLRIEHPQLATALAIQQTLIMAGQESDIATIIALATIGAGRPKLTERTLLKASTSVHEEINRISNAV